MPSKDGKAVTADAAAGSEKQPRRSQREIAAERAANLRGIRNGEKATFDPASQPGATEPLGYWDPLNLCPRDDKGLFRKYRISELKHGRVAMLASVGLVAQHFIRFPGITMFDRVPNGVMAIFNAEGGFGIYVVVFVCLVLEFVVFGQDPQKEVGDFGDPAAFSMVFGPPTTDLRNRELNNGRFAMFATMGILAAEAVTGKDAMQQFGFP